MTVILICRFKLSTQIHVKRIVVSKCMLSLIRPSFEVVNEGRILKVVGAFHATPLLSVF